MSDPVLAQTLRDIGISEVPFGLLSAPFPAERISWRVGAMTKDKSRGLPLAYIDARDVMQRLDDIIGPARWQDRYPHAATKTVCEIGIKVGDEWVWKSDGAGDTAYEADKGALSDAFKRAAVRWGIGRYLYDVQSPWIPLENESIPASEIPKLRKLLPKGEDFWGGPLTKTELSAQLQAFSNDLLACEDDAMVYGMVHGYAALLKQCEADRPSWWFSRPGSDVKGLSDRIDLRLAELKKEAA